MCCDKASDNRINHLHKRALKTAYSVSTFEKLQKKDNFVTTHVKNLRILATELPKTKENLAVLIMHKILDQKNIQNNLSSQTDFQLGSVRIVNYDLRALRYLGPRIWNIVPQRVLNNSR